MNKIILGTSSFGSVVDQSSSKRIIEAAFSAGIYQFDTGPFYGSGYASQTLNALKDKNCKISTKFGSWKENQTKFFMKKFLRARKISDFLSINMPFYKNEPRNHTDWWSIEDQKNNIDYSINQIKKLNSGFIFTHSPPVFIRKEKIKELSDYVESKGFLFGICSPEEKDLNRYLNEDCAISCYQLHLDSILNLSDQQMSMLIKNEVWIHGIYSSSPTSKCKDRSSRENFIIDLSKSSDSFKFVIGSKSVEGISRLIALNAKLY